MRTFFRFLWRNRLYSAINLVGFTVSLAFSIIIFTYAAGQFRIARSNPDHERIYAVGIDGSTLMCYGMADVLRSSLPDAASVVQLSTSVDGFIAEWNGMKYNTAVMGADRGFFDMFHVRFLAGGKDDFTNMSSVFVSESFAGKLGGGYGGLIGRPLVINGNQYVIAGVTEDFGKDIVPYADVVVNVANADFNGQYIANPFGTFGNIMTFIEVYPGTDYLSLESKVEDTFKNTFIEQISEEGWESYRPCLIRLDKLYFWPDALFLNTGKLKIIRILALAGLALILSALFNYINLNTALTGKRAKEMATRRLLGSTSRDIMFKYISESFVFTALCFVLALVTAYALVPVVDWLISDPVLDSVTSGMWVGDLFAPVAIVFYILAIVVVSVLAGIIPAVIASRFAPIDIVRGALRMKSRMVFSKVFIVVQNVLSVILIAVALTMEVQMNHLLGRPAGCNLEDVYYLSHDFSKNAGLVFAERLKSLPCVESVGLTTGIPGALGSMASAEDKEGNVVMVSMMQCDSTTFNMLDFNIVKQYAAASPGTVWLNSSAAKVMADDVENLGGVTEDFIILDAGRPEKFEYARISITEPGNLYFFNYAIKTIGSHEDAKAMINEAYDRFCEENYGLVKEPYYSAYMTDYLEDSLEGTKRNMRLVEMFMVVAILLSLSGLVAISIFYADSSMKGIALHKVFGSTVGSEILRNIRLYIVMTLIADIVAVPVAVFLAGRYLQEFAYRIDSIAWIFVVAVLLSLAITVLSVLWQVTRAARANPADVLKAE